MGRESDDKKKRMIKNEDPEGSGGGRLRFRNVDGDVPLRMRGFGEDNKDNSSNNDNKIDAANGSNDSSSRIEDNRSKHSSDSKDLCGKAANIEEMICEHEGNRWGCSIT